MAEEPPSSVNVMGDTTAVADYDFLDACVLPLDRSNAPFIIPWLCTPETRSGFRSFTNISEWRAYILGLGLDGGVCQPVVQKFRRALKLYPVQARTRKSFGFMTRKLSVTESQNSGQHLGTFLRRKSSAASANSRYVA